MFNRIFNKRGAEDQGKSRERGHSVTPAVSLDKAAAQADAAPYFDLTIDDTIVALDSELSGLGHMQVAQAAKERGWATLQRELQRHPVRAASPALLKGTGAKDSVRGGAAQPVPAGRSRGWRVALGSAAAVVAVMAALLGTYSAGLLGNGGGTGPVASVTTTQVSEPTTAVTTNDTTSTSVAPDNTSTTESNPTTTGTTESTTTTGSTPGTTGGTTATTGSTPSSTARTTPTTQPAQTTTTNPTQWASAQREKDAESAVLALADEVVRSFWDGDLSAALRMVASGAQGSLTQMVSSLNDPSGYRIVDSESRSSNTVRVTLEFTDTDDNPRFFLTVRVDEGGATITAISAGS